MHSGILNSIRGVLNSIQVPAEGIEVFTFQTPFSFTNRNGDFTFIGRDEIKHIIRNLHELRNLRNDFPRFFILDSIHPVSRPESVDWQKEGF